MHLIMKKIFNYMFAVCFTAILTSCEKGLEGLNKNKTNPTSLDPALSAE